MKRSLGKSVAGRGNCFCKGPVVRKNTLSSRTVNVFDVVTAWDCALCAYPCVWRKVSKEDCDER